MRAPGPHHPKPSSTESRGLCCSCTRSCYEAASYEACLNVSLRSYLRSINGASIWKWLDRCSFLD